MAAFLKNLPSHDPRNFQNFSSDSAGRNITPESKTLYITLKEFPQPQVITTEKNNLLLRHIHNNFGHKSHAKKRDATEEEETTNGPAKLPRNS